MAGEWRASLALVGKRNSFAGPSWSISSHKHPDGFSRSGHLLSRALKTSLLHPSDASCCFWSLFCSPFLASHRPNPSFSWCTHRKTRKDLYRWKTSNTEHTLCGQGPTWQGKHSDGIGSFVLVRFTTQKGLDTCPWCDYHGCSTRSLGPHPNVDCRLVECPLSADWDPARLLADLFLSGLLVTRSF